MSICTIPNTVWTWPVARASRFLPEMVRGDYNCAYNTGRVGSPNSTTGRLLLPTLAHILPDQSPNPKLSRAGK